MMHVTLKHSSSYTVISLLFNILLLTFGVCEENKLKFIFIEEFKVNNNLYFLV